ncbi:MAG: DUF4130 domain-containing protein [Candidatus Margulisiibacteriota bacterium]|jgi:probable DNA metabolism protein
MQKLYFENTPESFFNAVLQKHLQGNAHFLERRQLVNSADLFEWNNAALLCSNGTSPEARSDQVDHVLLEQYLHQCGGKDPLGKSEAFQDLLVELFFALHFRPENIALLEKAVFQALTKGCMFVTEKVSDEASAFMKMSWAVRREIHNAKAFMRLLPVEDQQVLFGEFILKHDTAPFILKHFMRRFPGYAIILLAGQKAWIAKNNEISETSIDRKNLRLPVLRDEFTREWLAFYQSQYIHQRRNIKLMKSHVPTKYWQYMDEMQLDIVQTGVSPRTGQR